MKRIALIAVATAFLSLSPLGAAPASACPDPNNPCDIKVEEIPGWCKLTPFC